MLVVGVPLKIGIEWAAEKRGATESHIMGGMHDVVSEETVIIKDINRSKKEITVEMIDLDNIYVREGDENPYDKDKVILEYSYEKDFYISDLELSDEAVFTHFYDTPYKIDKIKKSEKLEEIEELEENE